MILSPLSLKNYFVTRLSVVAPENVDASQDGMEGKMNNTATVETAQHQSIKNDWRVILKIVCTPADKNICGYSIEADLVGFFEIDPKIPEEKARDIVAANAPAMLYGGARELILLVTGRGPLAPYPLPSVSFIDQMPSVKNKQNIPKEIVEKAVPL